MQSDLSHILFSLRANIDHSSIVRWYGSRVKMLFQLWTFCSCCWARVRGQLGLRTGWVKGHVSCSQVLLRCSSHFWEANFSDVSRRLTDRMKFSKHIGQLGQIHDYMMHLHISFSIWVDPINKEAGFGTCKNWWSMTKLHSHVWIQYVGFIQVGELKIGDLQNHWFRYWNQHFPEEFRSPRKCTMQEQWWSIRW